MAGLSTREIKNRIRSMTATRQITQAMEMVASSKLRQTQNRLLRSRPYFEILTETIGEIAAHTPEFSSPYFTAPSHGKMLYIVMAGDQGLAGGYNSNVLRLCTNEMEERNAVVLPIGRKAMHHFKSRGFQILTEAYAVAEALDMDDCIRIAQDLAKDFLAGEYSGIHIVYTAYHTALSQQAVSRKVLPLEPETDKTPTHHTEIVYEPSTEAVFAAIVPDYVGGLLYGALCHSRCCEQAARRTAMEAAASNAADMIAELSLKYNRARQAAITNEIIDIVAGSDS